MSHLSEETLNLYLDDLLEPVGRAAAEAHLAGCESCGRELDALQTLFFGLDTLPAESIPRDLTAAVLARVAPVARRRTRLAAALLAAQLGFSMLLAIWLAPVVGGWPAAPIRFPAAPLAGLADVLNARGTPWRALAAANQAATDLSAPLGSLSAAQWALTVAAVGLIWLIGNRLLLAGTGSLYDRRQERA